MLYHDRKRAVKIETYPYLSLHPIIISITYPYSNTGELRTVATSEGAPLFRAYASYLRHRPPPKFPLALVTMYTVGIGIVGI